MRKRILWSVFFLAVLMPANAFAVVPNVFREYVTYGNFNAVVNCFQRIALLMSDTGMQVFTVSALVLSTMIWIALGVNTYLRSGTSRFFPGVVIILLGASVYITFIEQRSDLLIYDEPSNRHMVISQVPDGLILIAGIQNQFVNGAVDMIWTSADPESFRANAYGDIFNVLQNVFKKIGFVPSDADSSGKNLSNSLQRYFEDCVLFEMSRPGSTIDVNDFFANTNVLDILARSTNPSVFTVYYDTANPSGTQCSCSEAYDNINNMLNGMAEDSGSNEKFWTERCEKAGYFDYTGAAGQPAQEVCRDKAVDFLAMYLTPQSSLNLMQQYLVSNQIFNYIKLNQPELLTDFKVMTTAKGEATAAMRWLPIIKGAIFTAYLGITPFLFMLLPTLAMPKVVQFVFGIFVFMTCWDICDAVLHSYAMDHSIAAFREMLNQGLSLKSLWMMEGESQTAMIIFGKMRWVSMSLALTLSYVLTRFGGYAMAQMAGAFSIQGHGAQSAMETNEPTQRADREKALPHAMPTEAITNEHSFAALGSQSYYRQKTPLVGDTITMERLGGPGSAAEQIGQTDAHDTMRREQGMIADRHTAGAADMATDQMLYDRARSGAERSAGQAAADRNDWALTGSASSYGSLSEKASYLKNRALDDIKRTGGISDNTQENIDRLNQVADGRTAFLNSPAASTNLNEQEKANLGGWLRDNGYEVDQLGSQARMNFAMGPDGGIVPSGLNTFEGHSGRGGINYNETHGHRMDMAITPDNQVEVNHNGQSLSFVGGRLTGYEGGYHEIHDGVTSDGQLINGRIGQDGELIQTTHPSALQVNSSSMLNLLGQQALPDSHMDVKNNTGAAVEAWMGAVRTYASDESISNDAFNRSVNSYAETHIGTPLKGAIGSGVSGGVTGTAGGSWSDSRHVTENVLTSDIRERIAGAQSNQEALEIMQQAYNDLTSKFPKLGHPAYIETDNSKGKVQRYYEMMQKQVERHDIVE